MASTVERPGSRSTAWTQRCVALILRSRWLTLVLFLLLTGVAGYFASKITIDTSLEAWLLEDDATLLLYKHFREKFGEDEFVVLALETNDVFTPEMLGVLNRLTQEAQQIPDVHRVTSLTNVKVLRRQRTGRLSAQRYRLRTVALMSKLPTDEDEAEELYERFMPCRMIAGTLASTDRRTAAILVELSRDCDSFQRKAAVALALRARADACLSELDLSSVAKIRIAGTPVLGDAISRYIERDLRTFHPLFMLVVIVSTYVLFRRLAVALISLTVVGSATLWVLGLMGFLGIQMNLLGPVLTTVVLVVGIADSVHIFAAYFQALESGRARRAALAEALHHVLLPCFVTSVTTVAGFLSLLTSSLEPIRAFGTLSALGTAFAFLISIFLIPALVPWVPERKYEVPRAVAMLDRVLDRLGHPSRRTSWFVLLASALLIVFGIWSIPRLKATANPMNYFHPSAPVRQDAEAIDTALGGATSLEFIARAPNGNLKDVRVLERIDILETWLASQPSVTGVLSIGALVKEADRVLNDRSGDGQLPSTNGSLVVTLLTIKNSAGELFNAYVQDDFSLGRISARVKANDADRLAAQAEEIEAMVRSRVNTQDPELEVRPTGYIKLVDDMRKYVISSQVTTILFAFATITAVLMIIFRSWKLALFSLIPNVGPIILGLALMAWLKIYLDPGTVMIATIAMGLVVDDTCHFLIRLRRQFQVNETLPQAIAATMQQTGRPIISTSIILAAGFSVLLLGNFSTTVSFGLISVFMLLVALVADLVMLPAALLIMHPKL